MKAILVTLCLQLLVVALNSEETKKVRVIPEGYVKLGEDDFYKFHKPPVSWNVARQTCENEKAHLVIINSAEELKSIGDMMRSHGVIDIHAGFDDLVTEWDFNTIYGEPLSSTYVK